MTREYYQGSASQRHAPSSDTYTDVSSTGVGVSSADVGAGVSSAVVGAGGTSTPIAVAAAAPSDVGHPKAFAKHHEPPKCKGAHSTAHLESPCQSYRNGIGKCTLSRNRDKIRDKISGCPRGQTDRWLQHKILEYVLYTIE